ncbi:PilD-dependent protein PddA [Anaerohalosphaera lusitana]|uniref:Type II secretion system core protein G n=1 Tax=Anaerohalosphaera lusitana TaxID=1936003 RepID=A0A1U9NPJ6_9BACT|nr:type II secretion system major pseudopilin GspG [Anaerohalosphaera lusitana]AQT69638.1 PilD-dependent protein PddA [Anaerohalosphaera lusitana]
MRAKRRNRRAFTMVELIAIIVILGLLSAVAMRSFTGVMDKTRVQTTKSSLKTLHDAVIQFKFETGRYPSEDMGLEELVVEPTDVTGWTPGGYLETTEVPQDAWGNDFVYMRHPDSGKPFVIISYGADGEPGGEDYNADLYSTDAS